jgi:signal transduction histidine kinase
MTLTPLSTAARWLSALLLLAGLWSESCGAELVLQAQSPNPSADLRPYIAYFAAQSPHYSAHELAGRPDLFVPLQNRRQSWSANTHWYRLALHNAGETPVYQLLGCGVANPPFIRAYWVTDSGTDTLDPQQALARFASHANISIPLHIKPGESGVLLIEYRSLANFPLSFQLRDEQTHLERSFKFTLLDGMSLGAGLVLLLFFAAQFYLHRRPALGFYSLFVLCTLLFMAQIFGYGWRFFWPHMANINAHITSFVGALIYVFYFLFSAHLFEFRQHNRHLYRILVGWSCAIGILALIGRWTDTDLVLSLLVAFGLPFPIYGALAALRRRQVSAGYFLVGCSVHTLMTYCLLLACLGFNLGSQVFTVAAAGQFVDILCFSIAILLNHRHTERILGWQIQERQKDMEALSSSEQLAAQLRTQSKQTVLQAATSAHDLLQLLAAMRMQLATQDTADPLIARLGTTLAHADELLRSRLQLNRQDYWQLREELDCIQLLREIHERHAATLTTERREQFRMIAQVGHMVCLKLVVQRVLDNLLNNALRHSRYGRVLLTGRKRRGGYLIQVRDTGGGMAPARVAQLGLPFNPQAPGSEGYGLGLFIVTQLCQSVGYRFTLQSLPGRGTCCSLWIPHPEPTA